MYLNPNLRILPNPTIQTDVNNQINPDSTVKDKDEEVDQEVMDRGDEVVDRDKGAEEVVRLEVRLGLLGAEHLLLLSRRRCEAERDA